MKEPTLHEILVAWQDAIAERAVVHQRELDELSEMVEHQRHRADRLEAECERLHRANRLAGVFPKEEGRDDG